MHFNGIYDIIEHYNKERNNQSFTYPGKKDEMRHVCVIYRGVGKKKCVQGQCLKGGSSRNE